MGKKSYEKECTLLRGIISQTANAATNTKPHQPNGYKKRDNLVDAQELDLEFKGGVWRDDWRETASTVRLTSPNKYVASVTGGGRNRQKRSNR